MTNVLVIGKHGQLGCCLQDEYNLNGCYDIEYYFKGRDELDITSEESIERVFSEMHYDYVVNCAAYTQVDKAEDDIENAELVNAHAVKLLAEACAKNNSKFIHISTDYVFDGSSELKNEVSNTFPLQEYGLSKLNGEKEIINVGVKHHPNFKFMIIRTSWLYSKYRNNFVKTIYRKILQGEKFNVVYDQVGSPTSAHNLANCILTIIERCEKGNPFVSGIYHYSDDGVISWYDFAKAIEEYIYPTDHDIVHPCLSTEFPSKTIRPKSSIWSKGKLRTTYGIEFMYWKKALNKVLYNLS